jgi:hypothetical protein
MSFGLLVTLLHACARESVPAEGPGAQRSESFGFSDRCVKRPSTSVARPVAVAHDAGVQWIASPRDRWTKALVGYRGVVSHFSAVPLGNDREDFGKCLVAMHERIHPFFSDRYLTSLIDQPAGDPRNDMSLTTLVEIVIARDGSISQSRLLPRRRYPTMGSSTSVGGSVVILCLDVPAIYARPFKLGMDATSDAGVASPR